MSILLTVVKTRKGGNQLGTYKWLETRPYCDGDFITNYEQFVSKLDEDDEEYSSLKF